MATSPEAFSDTASFDQPDRDPKAAVIRKTHTRQRYTGFHTSIYNFNLKHQGLNAKIENVSVPLFDDDLGFMGLSGFVV